jgi:iron complex transport system substrate-binding protein
LSLVLTDGARAIDCMANKPLRRYQPVETKAFSIDYYTGYKILRRGGDQVLLKNKGSKLDCQSSLFQIETPVEKIVLTSTTQLPALELLSLEKSLVGFQGKKYIYSQRFKQDQISNISLPLIPEELLKIKPDLVMSYELNIASNKIISQMRKMQIPVVLNNDYLERGALARAEWIVYTASFFNKEEDAKKIFQEITEKYKALKREIATIKQKKKILVGDIQNGKWVTCGGQSDLAGLIKDAGGVLLLSSKSPATQSRSLEDLYMISSTVDIWLTQNRWKNINEQSSDSRYKKIKARKIFNNHKKIAASGTNDYWEMGMARPDIMLEDLASVFYPERFPSHGLVWYQQL